VFALVFGHGLWANRDRLGVGDWDYFVSHAQVAYTTVLDYGQLPLWSPYHCGGVALFENFQSRVYSPSFLLVLLLGPNLGSRALMALYLVLGFEGTRRFARALGAGPWAARLAAVAVAGNGAILTHIAVGHFGQALYLLWPWWLLGLLRAERESARGTLLAAVFLAFTYVEGGLYALVHGVLLAALWCGARAARAGTLAPMIAFVRVGAASILLSAYLLVPTALHLSTHARTDVVAEVIPLSALAEMLLSPNLDWRASPVRFAAQRWHYYEYAAYVGPLFVALLLVPLARAARNPARAGWLLAGVGFTCWALGDFAPWSPWTLSHHLPVLGSMHASGRGLLAALFCFAIAVALALEHSRFAPWLTAALALNLAWVTPRALDHAFSVPLDMNPDAEFTQRASVDHADTIATQSYTRMTEDVLNQRGTLRCYEPVRPIVAARPRWPRAGEAWLEPGGAPVETTTWSPNALVLRAENGTGQRKLLVNQNFHAGWSRADGAPVVSAAGLLSTPVRPHDREVVLRFRAPRFLVLCALSAGTLIALLAWLVWSRPRGHGA
jgi:hypothetical protein